MRIDFDLDDLTNSALKRLVKQLLTADEKEERAILKKLASKSEKNDLADLHEEKHGKPNTPKVTEDDMPYEGDDELPDIPKKKGKA